MAAKSGFDLLSDFLEMLAEKEQEVQQLVAYTR
jgi:hypothetical protein